MGHTYISGILGRVPLREAVVIHLRHNCFPPLPEHLADMCLEAIALGEAGEWDEAVRSVPGHLKQRHGGEIPAHWVVKRLHLEAFIGHGGFDTTV